MDQNQISEFISKIKFINNDECWIWIGNLDKDGYGIFKNKRAHRLSFELYIRQISPNMSICHSCNTPSCVNPHHLYEATHQKNIEYRGECGRTNLPIGSLNGNSKLTEEIIQDMIINIYNNKFLNINKVAEYYGISYSIVKKILLGTHWKNVTNQLTVPLNVIRSKVLIKRALIQNEVDIIKERLKNNVELKDICNEFQISLSCLRKIKYGVSWK
jgi:hypothetical protein